MQLVCLKKGIKMDDLLEFLLRKVGHETFAEESIDLLKIILAKNQKMESFLDYVSRNCKCGCARLSKEVLRDG